MKSVIALTFLACGLAFSGCQKDKEKDKVKAPNSLFETTELDAGTTNVVDSANITNQLNSNGASLRATDGIGGTDDSSAEDASGKCFTDKINALTASADKANVKISETVDVKDCLGKLSEISTVTVSKAELKLLFWFGCTNDSLADLDGKPISAIKVNFLDECKSEERVQQIFNAELDLVASATTDMGDGTNGVFEFEQRSLSGLQTRKGGPCVMKFSNALWTVDDDCFQFQRDMNVKSTFQGQPTKDNATEDYFSMTYHGITQAEVANTWYESGRFDIALDNWSGNVTYAGGTVAPTWSLTDGSVTRTGTIGATALTDGVTGKFAKRITQINKQLHLN